MKILLIQLSDIHITNKDNAVFSRGAKIVDAVRYLGMDFGLCVVAVTGDIAFSGKQHEYADSLYLLEEVKYSLSRVFSDIPVKFISIPGNHDCDFSLNSTARESVIKNAKQDNFVDSSVVDLATVVQENYFDLLKLYFSEDLKFNNKISWKYDLNISGIKILFNCMNTAWVSAKREKMGDMYFPVSYIQENYGYDLVISLLHHPFNWLATINSREVRKKVQAISDIILTGHEHDQTASKLTVYNDVKQESTHIEAGALQESGDNSTSEFNCIIIDTDNHRHAVLPFRWDKDYYTSIYPIESRWHDYKENPARKVNEFGIKEEFDLWLRDLGIQLTHPHKGVLSREDIFLFPDMSDVGFRKSKVSKRFNSEQFYGYLSENGKIILTGSSDSGKTTICKEVFMHYYKQGLIPVYLNGDTSKTLYADERIIALLGRECEKSYTGINNEQYRQISRDKRVIIIDDFEKIPFKAGNRSAKEILDVLLQFASKVIIVANDILLEASEVIYEGFSFMIEGENAFKQLRIQPFGHVLREKLIERWVSFDEELGEEQYYRKIQDVKGILDTVLDSNFVIPYPVIILPLLQAAQYNDTFNPDASTYGHFYELLINRSITEKSNRILISIKSGYLIGLAKFMFEKRTKEITGVDSMTFYREYIEDFDINISYKDIMSVLSENNLIEEKGDTVRFRYDYIHYYYTAKYLSSKLYDVDIQNEITNLIDNIHQDTSANTLLFLTHLTNDQFIIKQMTSAASKVFANVSPIYSFDGISFLDKAEIKNIKESVYQDLDIKESRRKRNEYLDSLQHEQQEENEDILPAHGPDEQNVALTDKQAAYMKRIGAAMKTLQILGQLLRNHVGNLHRDVKTSLVQECIGIGLRSLNSMIQSLEPHSEDFVRALAITFQEENPDLTLHAATNQAVQTLFQVIHNNAFSVLKRISNAVGSPQLTRLYSRLLRDDKTPILKLVNTTLQLDNNILFPLDEISETYESVKEIPVALSLLKSLTYYHFYTFVVPEKTKRSVFSIMKIQYNPKIDSNPSGKTTKKSK